MPDLATGLMTYPEFLEAVDGQGTGTFVIFDVEGMSGASHADEPMHWQAGEFVIAMLVDHVLKGTVSGELVARVGGDTFCIFTTGGEVAVDGLLRHLNLSPVPVHKGTGPTIAEADSDMKRRRNVLFPPRRGIKNGNV